MRLTPRRAAAAAAVLLVAVVVAAVLEQWSVSLAALALLNGLVLLGGVAGSTRAPSGGVDARMRELTERVDALTERVVASAADTRGELLQLRRELALERPTGSEDGPAQRPAP